MIDLSGRVALVTGGSRGIGWACVEVLARAGAECAFTYRRSEDAAVEAVREIRREGHVCEAVRLDLDDADSAREAVAAVVERLGRIDILVNNAGIWNVRRLPIEQLEPAEVDAMLRTNLAGTIQVTRHAAQDMLRRDWGRIITIGSTAGIRGEPGHSHYAAAKGALFAWSRSLVGELSRRGITVNVVSPGWVYTDMTREALTPEVMRRVEAEIPTGRISRPDEIAAAVAFLASPLAAQVTGVNLDVNGGAVFS